MFHLTLSLEGTVVHLHFVEAEIERMWRCLDVSDECAMMPLCEPH